MNEINQRSVIYTVFYYPIHSHNRQEELTVARTSNAQALSRSSFGMLSTRVSR